MSLENSVELNDSNLAIKIQHLSKQFKISHQRSTLFTQNLSLRLSRKMKYETLHVLNDLSFNVSKGEILGIIGNNGAGKTTLLKIIAGIIRPSSGTVITSGKLVPFLGLGVGFINELTAIDNIVLYGIILGLQKKEVMAKVPDVLRYAELEKYGDTKIAHFSSGMHARLAFSTAILVNPDILIIDEVMAVGDASFRKKSFQSFLDLVNRNKTVLFVSHNLDQIRELCDRVLCLHKGSIHGLGDPDEVVNEYLALQKKSNSIEDKPGSNNP